MGWSSFEERIDRTKIKYQVRLEFMNENRWAKKICRWNKNASAVVKEYRNRMLKLNMNIKEQQEEVKLAIEGEEFIEGERQMNRRIKKNIEKKDGRNGKKACNTRSPSDGIKKRKNQKRKTHTMEAGNRHYYSK